MKAGILALSGYNQRAIIALCRWAEGHGAPLHLVARDACDPIYLTRHGARVMLKRENSRLDSQEVCAWIQELTRQYSYEKVFIAPSTEFFNRFLLEHRTEVERAGGVIPLVDMELYRAISDKATFSRMCQTHGIPVPAPVAIPPTTFPLVAKPANYYSSKVGHRKPYILSSPEEWAHFAGHEDSENFFFQEFVPGKSVYLLAHLSQRGVVTASAQENLIQQRDGGSVVLARQHSFHEHPLAKAYLEMLQREGFTGLIMIEVRLELDESGGRMIEANPRMWGPFQFALDQGVDLMSPLFSDHGWDLQVVPSPQGGPLYYFWSGGLARDRQPFLWHQFTPEDFVQNFQDIAASDLFQREDTRLLYSRELACGSLT